MSTSEFKEYRWEILLIVFSVAILGISLGWFIEQGGPLPIPEDGLAVGEMAPPIKAAGWVNGLPPSAESLRGNVYVIDAWATYCYPCRIKAPQLVATYNQYKGQVQFIGLTTEGADTLQEINDFIREQNISWPNGYGAIETMTALKSNLIPEIWVVGRDGKIVWNHNSPGNLVDGIEMALKGPKPKQDSPKPTP